MRECFEVAFASVDGEAINEHFGRCENYYLYRVCQDSFTFLQKQSATKNVEDEAKRLGYKISLLQECSLVVVTQIGPKASLLLKHAGINSIATNEGMAIEKFIKKLQQMLANENKPLWLQQILARSKQCKKIDM
ncbi:MAG: NifB/NifX family molybdenum-iron cluster-binding protein [Campylobacterota bacterium]